MKQDMKSEKLGLRREEIFDADDGNIPPRNDL